MTRHADYPSTTRIDPIRTIATSFALVLHIAAFALLVAPVRVPDLGFEPERPRIEVVMNEREIPPPPPPPVVPVTPPRAVPTSVPHAATPPVSIPNPEPAQPLSDMVPEITPVSADLAAAGDTTIGDAFAPEQIGAVSYLDAPPPRYPSAAIKRRLQGEVMLIVSIGNDGRPETVQVQHSSGHAVLDRAAVEQVQRRWRFRPLIVGGLPTRARALVPVRFSLIGK